MTSVPLVLLPGLLCDAALWRPQIERFGARCALSVADLTLDDTIAAMAERVLGGAPERFVLAGLSMGGYVALEIMRRAPERVRRLALLDTSARSDTDEQVQRRKALIDLARRGKFKGVTPRLLPLLIHPDRLDEEPLTRVVMEMAERVGQAAFLRQQQAILSRPDSRADLPRIACPTLVVCGAQDALTPPALAEETNRAIPQSRLALIDDCGHLATLERPGPVNEALETWLDPEFA